MDETIKEVYDFSVKAQEREIDLIKNRLEFINWLFGVASALLFSAVVAARTITSDNCPAIAPENLISLSIGCSAFIAILCTFIGKWQGYNSVGSSLSILTLLDIQKLAFLKEQPPSGTSDDKAVKFTMFSYLPEPQKQKYDSYVAYGERKYSEVLWLIVTSGFVFLSLVSMLLLLAELTI